MEFSSWQHLATSPLATRKVVNRPHKFHFDLSSGTSDTTGSDNDKERRRPAWRSQLTAFSRFFTFWRIFFLTTILLSIALVRFLFSLVLLHAPDDQPSSPPPSILNDCVITISAWNNFGFVWNLYDSIQENSPLIECFVWFVGDSTYHLDKTVMQEIRDIADKRFTVVTMEDMERALVDSFRTRELVFKFDMFELQTTLKPFAFKYVFQEIGAASCIFLDNDIWVTDSLLPLQHELQKRSALVTPHIISPMPIDGYKQRDLDILMAGVFNFGFVAFHNSPQALAFIDFWSERLLYFGYADIKKGMFYDQNWGMFIPSFFDHDDYMVIRDPRYNIAYWNLHYTGNRIHLDEKSHLPYIDEQRAGFVHFSGISRLEAFDVFEISRYQTRFTLQDFPRLEPVLTAYMAKLDDHSASVYRAIPYGYSSFSDGTQVDSHMRRMYAAAIFPTDNRHGLADADDATSFYGITIPTSDRILFQEQVHADPFCQGSYCKEGDKKVTYLEWFFSYLPEYATDSEGCFFFSGLEQAILLHRDDVDVLFEDPLGSDFWAFKDWFITNAVKEGMVTTKGFRRWQLMWDDQCARHEEFHKRATTLPSSIGFNIFGWHGGQFSIGITATKLYAAAIAANITTHAIQFLAPPRQKFTHPSLLGYKLSRSPREVVNIFAVNADYTVGALDEIPSTVKDNKYNVGFWAWELDVFPLVWMGLLNVFDEIWCPSEFVRKAITSSLGYDGTPVFVLNLPLLREEAKYSSARPTTFASLPTEIVHLEETSKPFVFMVVFDFQSHAERKNPTAAIQAFLEAFPAESDRSRNVCLLVKSHGGTSAQIEELHRSGQGDPRVIFISRTLSDAENIALHHYQDCYISLHRSEGYGLNILESMGAGIPVIATNYGGNVDFWSAVESYLEVCFFPVPFNLVKLRNTVGPYTAGNHWAEPQRDYVVQAMKKVVESLCKEKHGQEIVDVVYKEFGDKAIGMKIQAWLESAIPRIMKKQETVLSPNLKLLRDEVRKRLP